VTTNSSERTGAHPYSRFIPREELEGFAAWRPDAFGDTRPGAGSAQAVPTEAERTVQRESALAAARQEGYQSGYRDGLVALESFKQSFMQQMAAQIGQLVASFDAEFAALEAEMAQGVARIATAMARQVVRDELATRPDLVATIAAEAVNGVLMTARHIRVHVHPDDLPLVKAGAADALAARQARVLPDATLTRGGVRIDSDLGTIDASLEGRWAQAAAALGQDLPLTDPDAPA
jgi:flagellar assembly protein FliH